MAKNGWYRTRIFLVSIFLATHYYYAEARNKECSPALSTPGYTDPYGDIEIEYGNPLNITCVLNDKYILANSNKSSQDLYFIQDNNQTIPSEMIHIINKTSIMLQIEKPPRSSSVYTCKLRNLETAVCLNKVMVGNKPLPVNDLECIGYYYENLTCTWTTPNNFIKTYYNLTHTFPGRAGRAHPIACPEGQPRELSDGKMYCTWTSGSKPPYRQVQRTFYFHLNITNKFGTIIVNKTFSHFSHVLAGAPENLTKVNVTSESILLKWAVPIEMQWFPPGWQHRIMYQSIYDNKIWQAGDILKTREAKYVHYNLTALKYAHTVYDIRVSMRSADAKDEYMWSKNSTLTVLTASKIPGAPPASTVGSFQVASVGSSMTLVDVYVYWQQLDNRIKNGENFHYKIEADGRGSGYLDKITSAYALFTQVDLTQDHVYKIWSRNEMGSSEHYTSVFVPKERNRLSHPISFTKIAFDHGNYELQWEHPKQNYRLFSEPIKNYTIFWCSHDNDRPYQCSGFLNWTFVDGNKTTYNVTVPEDKIYQFAISANSESSSSGMVWASCVILYDQPVGKIGKTNTTIESATYIEVTWQLDCADGIGSVKKFIVFYCNIVSPADTTCKGTEQNVTIEGGSSVTKANITNLKPYHTYMLAVAAVTKQGTQTQKSMPMYRTTSEAAPVPITHVEIVDATNSTVTISWQKPNETNGFLKYYKIKWNDEYVKFVASNETYEKYTMQNLLSYTDYNISVEACTVECSEASPIRIVKTDGGYPSQAPRPSVTFQNDSHIVVGWERPLFPRGNEIYEIRFTEKLQFENHTLAISNVTERNYNIEGCGANGKYNTFYVSVRAMNIFNGERYEGPWSEELESYCRTSPSLWLWTLIPACFFLVLGLFYMSKRMYFHCQEMRDVEVKLPSGLAPTVTADIGLTHWNSPKIPEEQIHHPPADEELLLMKMNGSREFSGDSSGCSSGHESVTSSLESGTHLSSTSDSGTEQPRSSLTDDLHKNSLRLRNVAAVRPAKGYVTMPADTTNPTTWNSKAASGNYCILGVDPIPVTSINPNYVPASQSEPKLPRTLADTSVPPSSYVLASDLNSKPSNSGYVPLNSTDEKSPAYVMAGSKAPVVTDFMRLESVKAAEDKPVYVQVADPTSTIRKASLDSFTRHQPSVDTLPTKTGYVSIGDAPNPRVCTDLAKGYIPHRHFDAKTLKED